mmetsp:Transcript_2116/g.5204  ORF Transcript_2116/g.5204 Transcript_2116/m.5204 type:complete len:389 (-) Transcript_2116:127-1293(-)
MACLPDVYQLRADHVQLLLQAVGRRSDGAAEGVRAGGVHNFQCAGVLRTHEDAVSGVCLGGPGGRMLDDHSHRGQAAAAACIATTCSWDGWVRCFDLEAWEEGPSQRLGSRPLLCVASSPCKPSLVACGSSDSMAWLWTPGNSVDVQALRGHMGEVNDIEFHPLRADVACTASADGSAIAWDLARCAELRACRHDADVTSARFLATDMASEQMLATACADRQVRLWDLRTPARRCAFPVPALQHAVLAVHRAGRALLAGTDMGRLVGWDLRTLRPLRWGGEGSGGNAGCEYFDLAVAATELDMDLGESGVAALEFSPCGNRLAVSSRNGQVLAVDLADHAWKPVCAHNDAVYGLAWGTLKPNNAWPFLLCASHDSSWSCWMHPSASSG